MPANHDAQSPFGLCRGTQSKTSRLASSTPSIRSSMAVLKPGAVDHIAAVCWRPVRRVMLSGLEATGFPAIPLSAFATTAVNETEQIRQERSSCC